MIPIFSANKIESDDIIIGYLIENEQGFFIIKKMTVLPISNKLYTQIDAETLKISFDNGKSFIKLSDLEVHTCTDFKLGYTNMQMNTRKEVQPPNGSIFTIITDKGR